MGASASQIVVIALLVLHALQFYLYPEVMNVRTSVAAGAFLLISTFAPYCSTNRYAVLLLQIFGIAVALLVMSVLHVSAR